MEHRIVSGNILPEDKLTSGHRPVSLEEFIGQDRVKKQIYIYINSALKRNEPLDHVLLSGPPGLGKTTLANIIANELNVNIKVTSGPAIERAGDLAAILTGLSDNDVLFIDEVHRLSKVVEEVLYPAMEDYEIDIVIGKGPTARTVRLALPRFTLIGATTMAGKVSTPLRSRFGILLRLDYYKIKSLTEIIFKAAKRFNIKIQKDAANLIAKRARGTPRVALRLLKRLRDVAIDMKDKKISKQVVEKGMELMQIDSLGLEPLDREILLTIIDKFNGGPVSLDTVAVTVGEEPETIYEVYEPFLIKLGLIERTPRGRIATETAYKHLNKKSRKGQIEFNL